ncbi:MAG: acetylglutamate kinase [Bacteroidetes bacterium]|nr:MAG: acetylglutamate kinase [Bacteroidota bacterium]
MPRLTLVKIGGKVLDDPRALAGLLDDFSALPGARVLVHGGGKLAADLAQRLGIETSMVGGRRITSREMLEVVTMVYGGLLGRQLVAGLQARGINALSLTGADLDLMRAHRRPVREVDFGYVGDIDAVRGEALHDFLSQGIVPVVAPLTHDGAGQLLNTNADTIASQVALALADRWEVHLVFTFEKPGVMEDPDDETSLIRVLDPAAYARYREAGVIAGGMLPKLDNAFAALANGVARVYICQAEALPRLYQPDFVGTTIQA